MTSHYQQAHSKLVRDQLKDEMLSIRTRYPNAKYARVYGSDEPHEFTAYLLGAYDAGLKLLCTSNLAASINDPDFDHLPTTDDILEWISHADFSTLVDGGYYGSHLPASVLMDDRPTFINDNDGRRFEYIFNLDELAALS